MELVEIQKIYNIKCHALKCHRSSALLLQHPYWLYSIREISNKAEKYHISTMSKTQNWSNKWDWMSLRLNKEEKVTCCKWSITLTSKWPRWRLESPASRLFTQSLIQAQIKENIKVPRHWPLCREFTGTGEFPAQRASNAENVSIWWRHHALIHVTMEPIPPKSNKNHVSWQLLGIMLLKIYCAEHGRYTAALFAKLPKDSEAAWDIIA